MTGVPDEAEMKEEVEAVDEDMSEESSSSDEEVEEDDEVEGGGDKQDMETEEPRAFLPGKHFCTF
jgi:hypothetical protein